MAAAQHAHLDLLKVSTKNVTKYDHQNQAINNEISNNQSHIMSADQKILNGKGWANNPETNNAKNKLVRTYFRTDQGKNLFENPLIINSGKNAGRTTKEKIEVFPV